MSCLLLFGVQGVEFVAGSEQASNLDFAFPDADLRFSELVPHVLEFDAHLVEAHFGCVVLADDEMDELVPGAGLLHFCYGVADVHYRPDVSAHAPVSVVAADRPVPSVVRLSSEKAILSTTSVNA